MSWICGFQFQIYDSTLFKMKKLFYPIITLCLLLGSCGKKNGGANVYPENFSKIGDVGRLEYMIRNVTPDSLARFMVNSALNRNPGAPIDTLATAILYVYEHLSGPDLDAFNVEYNDYIETLPLIDKMKINVLGSSDDVQKVGYRLGLEYLGTIRENNKSVAEIEKELKAFKKECGSDTAMYRRFIIGFHTVLDVDSGKDVSAEIYNKFRNYE